MIKHLDGVCHVYVDDPVDMEMAMVAMAVVKAMLANSDASGKDDNGDAGDEGDASVSPLNS